jgi:uncharacterized protein YjbI with pentapeptide repeats
MAKQASPMAWGLAAVLSVGVVGFRLSTDGVLRARYRGRGPDLRGSALAGVSLRGADLRDANLEGALLVGTELDDANLSGAKLRRANLSGASLYHARLNGAQFRWRHSGTTRAPNSKPR